MESQLAEYLKKCTLINHGLSPKETKVIALSFAIANGTRIPTAWHKNGQASEDWLSGFLKRNQSLSIRKPEATSQARAAGFNKPVVDNFYDKYESLVVKHKFKAYQVFNCDETNNPTVMQPPNVIAAKGTKQVQQTVSAERGTNVTMLAFVNAAGGSVPPVFIFPRKKLLPVMFEKGPSGCIGLAHECGWMTGFSFFKSLQHFQSFVKCSKSNPVLLLLDNHSSHLDYQVVSFAKDNGIILLTFPPHCSHALQPLDVSVFGPFKRACGKSQNDWLNRNPGQRISIKEIEELSNVPYQEAITPKNIIAGFQSTGIFPFNRFMINPSRFAPSFVTDRPCKPDFIFCYFICLVCAILIVMYVTF
ncbi:MFS-type transporter clz9-like [Daphnia magna]|uniref:MFS-type transporter clz9-like n=1 Tax=Daphnia magna TaxID=35525 RepID=UPI001E1BA131|nr:MFS-type transporter clz9-like [Daphnia magna]